MMKLTVRVGPFSVHFTNVNKAMGLRGHSHFATVDLYYAADGAAIGFPSFEDTHAPIREALKNHTAKPFQDATNEDVAKGIFDLLSGFESPEMRKWGGYARLRRIDLNVRGVPDDIGHGDGFTTYTWESV